MLLNINESNCNILIHSTSVYYFALIVYKVNRYDPFSGYAKNTDKW